MGASKFVLRTITFSLGLFGLLRLPWVETHLVLPATHFQADAAVRMFGTATSPIEATLACSGTDAIALCLGAILAYPVLWRRRWLGALGGVTLILGLNIMRIGTLGRAAAHVDWFNALHLYIWPAVLTVAIAGYVFGWMRIADRAADAPRGPAVHGRPRASQRFIVLSIVMLLIFVAAAPFYLDSAAVLAVAGFIARIAATALSAVGMNAHAAGNVLSTSRGAYMVTQECIATPMIPIFLAAVVAYATSWRWMVLGVVAAVPLFIALGIVRLLVVALPVAAVSPEFLVHAFFQLLTAVILVVAAALWRYHGRTATPHAVSGVLIGALCIVALSPWSAQLVAYPASAPLNDPQGAIAFLPAFQIGLFVALWVAAFVSAGWKRFAAGLAALALTQAAFLLVLHVLTTNAGLTAHVREVRGWAIAAPLIIIAMVTNLGRAHR
jgi:exosortase/archaeosortase family protein